MTRPTPSSAAHQILLTDLEYLATTAPGGVEESSARVATQLIGIERLLSLTSDPYARVVYEVVEGLNEIRCSAIAGRYNPQPAVKLLLDAMRADGRPKPKKKYFPGTL